MFLIRFLGVFMNEFAKALRLQLKAMDILIAEKDEVIENLLKYRQPAEIELLRRLQIQKKLNLSLIDEIQKIKADKS